MQVVEEVATVVRTGNLLFTIFGVEARHISGPGGLDKSVPSRIMAQKFSQYKETEEIIIVENPRGEPLRVLQRRVARGRLEQVLSLGGITPGVENSEGYRGRILSLETVTIKTIRP